MRAKHPGSMAARGLGSASVRHFRSGLRGPRRPRQRRRASPTASGQPARTGTKKIHARILTA
eukprot:7544095-Lingulodinium_polyedra.AAC.1